ncbi:MAG: DUF2892 domain-containing protein [Gammaproteobacteria bacterium]|jgi:hypothetical protein|nr:DUF2892 domain-containing protein [Gammaproteobacteria bacterium]
MNKNVGGVDRTIRLIAGLAIAGAGLYYQSLWGLIGAVLIVTAVLGWCPPYSLLGINTCKKPAA